MTYIADRSLNKRSSDKPKTMWSSLFGATDTRTEFDHRVDAYVKKEQMKSQKSKLGSSSKKLSATTFDHDLNYAVVVPMFLGEVRMGDSSKILDVVFDTGSDWLVVPDIDCDDCDGEKHDSSSSAE
jgi:hypothetical protein